MSLQATGSAPAPVQVAATPQSVHDMLVAVLILALIGMGLVIVAGLSDGAADGVIGLLAVLLLVQGVTRVSPFVAWLAAHPLTPAQAGLTS